MRICISRFLTLLLLLLLHCEDSDVRAQQRYWVFLTTKTVTTGYTPHGLGITDRALQRRAKSCSQDCLIDDFDYPVDEGAVVQIQSTGAQVRSRSRWLNAVSVLATKDQQSRILRFPFVHSLRTVSQSKRRPVDRVILKHSEYSASTTEDAVYGSSLRQVRSVNALPLHKAWVTGKNVLIGMLDDGFQNYRTHSAFRTTIVLGEYDFVQRDNNTSRSFGEYATQGNHGAQTLSVVGGYEQGKLVGVAYGASFYLAKTEIDSIEVAAEEDNFIEGLEWLERQGVDIVSASLGYDDFDPTGTYARGNGLYDPGDIVYSMKDGRTAPTTRAVQIAARKGVLVVVSAGNEGWAKRDTLVRRDSLGKVTTIVWGTKAGTGSITTPADADSILAVGALYSTGTLAYFSSTGPTADGRIKPDVVAQGSLITAVDPRGTNGYVSSASGTSFAAPLVAGAAALVLSAHPYATAMEIRSAILATAQQIHDTLASVVYPNNYYGYGRVDAFAAALSLGPVVSNTPSMTQTDSGYIVATIILAKTSLVEDSILFYYHFHADEPYSVAKFRRSVDSLFTCFVPTTLGTIAPRGYIYVKETTGKSIQRPIGEHLLPREYILFQNYPNPFNSTTTILFDIGQTSEVEVAIYNVLGKRIKTLASGWLERGRYAKQWNGLSDDGHYVTSGVYFCRLKARSYAVTRKILYLR
ncbi:MAG: S8 family serine peptidase [Bacteroidetes bacterium]|nr:S8 family serine peptidase [Bacteroidota bacterium]